MKVKNWQVNIFRNMFVLWANFFAKGVQAVPWASTMANWGKREQLTLVNNSGQTLIQLIG